MPRFRLSRRPTVRLSPEVVCTVLQHQPQCLLKEPALELKVTRLIESTPLIEPHSQVVALADSTQLAVGFEPNVGFSTTTDLSAKNTASKEHPKAQFHAGVLLS